MKEIVNGYNTVEYVITDNSFRIPTYQRGYRWEEHNVSKLLEDIYENKTIENSDNSDDFRWVRAISQMEDNLFNMTNNRIVGAKNPYCIQPLVVCKNADKTGYDVIDGQQRLTTIAIAIRALKAACSKNGLDLDLDKLSVNLSYESRQDSEKFISKLGEENADDPNKNIDFMYIDQAYKVAKKFFEDELKKPGPDNRKNYANLLKDILLKNTRFIWYCIDSTNMDPHEVFANFNTGKIELTNSELVKALFMDTANYDETSSIDDKRIVISEKWDEIENALHNPDFWAFVPHKNQYGDGGCGYDTRIDVIFEMFIMRYYVTEKGMSIKGYEKGMSIKDYLEFRRKKDRDRFIFDEIDSWIKDQLAKGNDKKSKNKIMQECWYEIRKIYLGLLEFYEIDTIGNHSNKLYNMAGLYINFKNRKKGNVDDYSEDSFLFLEVYNDLANVLEKPRSSRMAEFQKLIKAELGIIKKEDPVMTDSGINNEKNIEKFIKDIRYTDSASAEKIVKVLLAYNIGLLNSSDGIGQRFNFREFAKLKWEREHIFASNMDESKNISYAQKEEKKKENEKENEKEKEIKESGAALRIRVKNMAESEEKEKIKETLLKKENQRKTALSILAKDIKKDSKCYTNSYVEYVRNVYFFNEEFPPKNSDKELDFDDDRQVSDFISNSTNTRAIKMLKTALRTNRDCKKMLDYYDIIDRIKFANGCEEEVKKRILYSIIEDLGRQLSMKEYVDVKILLEKKIIEALKNDTEQNTIDVEIYGSKHQINKDDIKFEKVIINKDDKKEYIIIKDDANKKIKDDNIITDGDNKVTEDDSNNSTIFKSCQESFNNYVRNLYMEKSDGADVYTIKKCEGDKGVNWKEMYNVFELCMETLYRSIDKFFADDFVKLLKDDTMGNMTLLTGNKETESQKQTSQNQKVSNESYMLKKDDVHNFFQSGDFVPLGTLLVFSDVYNNSENVADFWLPDSRLRYLNNMIKTLKSFLGSSKQESENNG